jgi:hypothetical protein
VGLVSDDGTVNEDVRVVPVHGDGSVWLAADAAAKAVAWLRGQVEADRLAADLISAGGYAPQCWDTDPRGQNNPQRMSQLRQIDALLTGEDGPAFRSHGYWVAVHSWDCTNIEPESARVREDDVPVAIVNDGRREVDHIRRNDPRNTVARCDSHLALLGEHKMIVAGPDYHDWGVQHGKWHVVAEDPTENDLRGLQPGLFELHCRCCRSPFPCRTVTIVASAYKHREGYAQHWG